MLVLFYFSCRDRSLSRPLSLPQAPMHVVFNHRLNQVVITDYPDDELVENISYNIVVNIPVDDRDRVSVQVRAALFVGRMHCG